MKTGLIILGICLAVLILIEVFRKPRQSVNKPNDKTISLVFKATKDGNFKASKRLNSFFELLVFKGNSYSDNEAEVFIELYIYVSLNNKQSKIHALSKHLLIDDLESFMNVIK